MDVSLMAVVGSLVGMLSGGAAGSVLTHMVFNRPMVRVRASFIARHHIPLVIFRLVNTRKDEVHVQSITGLRKKRGAKEVHFLVRTKHSKWPSFRLKGLDAETFEAEAHEAFPDAYALSEIKGFFVEDVTNPRRRWYVHSRAVPSGQRALADTT
jgi:hypothetical protein